MSDTKAVATTNIVGYFNGARWPIQLVISSLNITLHLKPGEFVLDKLGRKINDPFFEGYKQLSKETGDSPLPIIAIPHIKANVEFAPDGQSVHGGHEWTVDKKGVRQPVLSSVAKVGPNAINAPSVRGYPNIADARKAGLIKPTRVVPEDYGVPDTAGAPPSSGQLPTIKYAVDSPTAGRTPGQPGFQARIPHQPALALPEGAEQLSDDSRTQKTASERTELQKALRAGQAINEQLDSETGFMNTVVPTVVPAPAPEPDIPTAPVLEDEPATPALPAPKPAPVAPSRKFICAADGRTFPSREALEQHIKRRFPQMHAQLMQAYPA